MNFSKSEIFDPNGLPEALGDSDPTVLLEFYRLYLDHTSKAWERILAAARENDGQSLNAAAHSLKSSSASIGAHAFASLMANLEATTRDSETVVFDPTELSFAADVLESTIDSLKIRLQHLENQENMMPQSQNASN